MAPHARIWGVAACHLMPPRSAYGFLTKANPRSIEPSRLKWTNDKGHQRTLYVLYRTPSLRVPGAGGSRAPPRRPKSEEERTWGSPANTRGRLREGIVNIITQTRPMGLKRICRSGQGVVLGGQWGGIYGSPMECLGNIQVKINVKDCESIYNICGHSINHLFFWRVLVCPGVLLLFPPAFRQLSHAENLPPRKLKLRSRKLCVSFGVSQTFPGYVISMLRKQSLQWRKVA